ncbi:MAG: 50S ribosomal protein L29 [Rikenellaceae bacterium]
MKTSEIKELTVEEIQERIEAAKAELSKLKINHAISPVENPTIIRKSRQDIARMLTVLRQTKTLKS